MINIFKKLIKHFLKYNVKILLWRYHPVIIAISGSTNKHTTKELIYDALSPQFKVRKGPKNYNAEIGVPLTILGQVAGGRSVFIWLKIFLQSIASIFFSSQFPEVLILEVAISRPSDMDYLLGIFKPNITVITDITPKYADNFEDLDSLADEYLKLAAATSKNGLVLLNHDDIRQKSFSNRSGNVIFYGLKEGSEVIANGVKELDDGIQFEYSSKKRNEKIKINKFGIHNIYAVLISEIIKDYFNEKNYAK